MEAISKCKDLGFARCVKMKAMLFEMYLKGDELSSNRVTALSIDLESFRPAPYREMIA